MIRAESANKTTDLTETAKGKLIFPLDVPSEDEAKRFIALLADHIGCFKIGIELFLAAGPDIASLIPESSKADPFLDLKRHNIPETVRRALKGGGPLPRTLYHGPFRTESPIG